MPEQIALVDDQWIILAVNPAWTKTAALYGYDALIPGTNYLEFCAARANEGHSPAAIVVDGINEMKAPTGLRSASPIMERIAGRASRFSYASTGSRSADRTLYTVTRYDVTELVHLRQMREEFSHSLIEHQGEERRRMAREVHDSTMQLLAGMGLSLGQLKRTRHSRASGEIVDEMEQLLTEAQRELRAISYLAHAPEVSELGLAKALRQLAGGFGRRTGLNIAMDADEDVKLSPAAEVAVYRMVQEALSNVHRHSRATDAAVGLYQRRSNSPCRHRRQWHWHA